MARFRPYLRALLIAVGVLCPVASIHEANALILPPNDTDIPPSQGGSGGYSASGGSPGVAEPPPMVYLHRYTYYVGEVITGQLDCPDCYPDGPLFTDPLGMEVAGTIVYDDIFPNSFVFIPNEPLSVGLYGVQIDYSSTNFEVIEGVSLEPTYEARLIEDPHAVGDPLACQSYVPGNESYAYPQTRVDARLSIIVDGESSDQYSYEYLFDDEMQRRSVYGDDAATFREGNGEFCIEVFAVPYNSDPEISLGTKCLDPDEELDLGVQDIPYGTVESVLRVCELPPDGYWDAWCDYHVVAFDRHSCQGFVEEACVGARYECEDGDLPEWYDENGIDPNDPNAPYNPGDPNYGNGGAGNGGSGTGATGNGANGSGASGSGAADGSGASSDGSDSSSEVGGCSCQTGASARLGSNNRALFLLGLGGAMIALRRRGRRLYR